VYSLREVSSNVATYQGGEGFVYTVQINSSAQRNKVQPVFGRDFFEDEIVFTKTDARQINAKFDPATHSGIVKILSKYKAFNGLYE